MVSQIKKIWFNFFICLVFSATLFIISFVITNDKDSSDKTDKTTTMIAETETTSESTVGRHISESSGSSEPSESSTTSSGFTTTSASCSESIDWLGNGYCNDELNTAECHYDLGDCCLPQVSLTYCDVCTCHSDPNKCPSTDNINNGICDIELQLPQCDYDGTDCLPKTTTEPAGCYFPNLLLVDNGYCDDSANIEVCGYDGGDCCGPNVNTEYCTDCQCKEPDNAVCTTGILVFVGDGVCDEFNNNVECLFDGGDCDVVSSTPPWFVG